MKNKILIAAAALMVIILVFILIVIPKNGSNNMSSDSDSYSAEILTTEEQVMNSEIEIPIVDTENLYAGEDDNSTVTETIENASEETEAPCASVTLVSIGDMLMHCNVSNLSYQPDGTRNYNWLFDSVRADVQNADLAAVNNEVIFGGNELGLHGFPDFNVYTELGDAEAETGFDIALSATNHTMDMGASGVHNTLNFWTGHPEVLAAGIHASQEDQDSLKIIERNGIRIAVYNLTYSLNSYNLPEDEPYLVDLLNEWDTQRIASYLDRAEEEADFTIVFPHWGTEYEMHHNAEQENWAKFFTEHGADLIIGTHPHVLQDISYVTADNGRTSLCYYSLGNFVSLQDKTISMVGGEARVTISKNSSGTYISDNGLDLFVTYYNQDLSETRVYRFSDFTAEMAVTHGINTIGFDGDGSNAIYPMTLDGLKQVVRDTVGEQYLPAS